MRQNVKNKIAGNIKSLKATGGGPGSHKQLSEIEQRIDTLLAIQQNTAGLPNRPSFGVGAKIETKKLNTFDRYLEKTPLTSTVISSNFAYVPAKPNTRKNSAKLTKPKADHIKPYSKRPSKCTPSQANIQRLFDDQQRLVASERLDNFLESPSALNCYIPRQLQFSTVTDHLSPLENSAASGDENTPKVLLNGAVIAKQSQLSSKDDDQNVDEISFISLSPSSDKDISFDKHSATTTMMSPHLETTRLSVHKNMAAKSNTARQSPTWTIVTTPDKIEDKPVLSRLPFRASTRRRTPEESLSPQPSIHSVAETPRARPHLRQQQQRPQRGGYRAHCFSRNEIPGVIDKLLDEQHQMTENSHIQSKHMKQQCVLNERMAKSMDAQAVSLNDIAQIMRLFVERNINNNNVNK